jgi:protein involved in plasmid replication-relaxation
MASFAKFERPPEPRSGRISERDLDIVEAILRHRFSPTSELARLVGGHEDVTQRRLRMLWERSIVNRFAFPGIRNHSEFIYYLDHRSALELLVQHQRLTEIHPQMEEEIRLNREADYAGAVVRDQHMKLGFLKHSLMISRLHFMLEMSSRSSHGKVEIADWRQGGELRGHKVNVPEIVSRRIAGTNDYDWEEQDRTYRLPVEPDALFSMRFPDRPEEQQISHFCYEADRGSMPMADMLKKMRAYYHFIKRQQKHRHAFGVHPIRAVLIETTTEARARKLMELAEHPAVIGAGKRSALFWFCISPLFTAPTQAGNDQHLPTYLLRPEILLDRLWALPDLTMHGLGDAENSRGPGDETVV